ncbi:hypothetical protein DOTSEDRAFT_73052 [Dothistroma septosporum NZE10]|uniref:Uncharacterized protein n=1 Tax=Dothistroma septosporum (strain NZE10 / CBS 128990) TaxID=675120 RepID=N1PIC2_DOTSN|nr:hypothetical protein DOTSEDRAFT_73052 [Dothistroma septosporum NZE10]
MTLEYWHVHIGLDFGKNMVIMRLDTYSQATPGGLRNVAFERGDKTVHSFRLIDVSGDSADMGDCDFDFHA